MDKKRTFSQFQDVPDQAPLMYKKQKLNQSVAKSISPTPSASQSIEILPSITASSIDVKQLNRILTLGNKENDGDFHNFIPKQMQTDTNTNTDKNTDTTDTNIDWINDSNCVIVQHRLENEWYHFKIKSKPNNTQCAWLKHKQLCHLPIYDTYLKQSKLSIEEVSEPQYVIEQILKHEYNEESDEVEFYVKWKNYSCDWNTWEPHSSLQQNRLYIRYCKAHDLDMIEGSDSDSDSECDDIEYERLECKEYSTHTTETCESAMGIDIESEYLSSKQNSKAFGTEYIHEIIEAIDTKTSELFEMSANQNSKMDLQSRADRLQDMRGYFERLECDLLFEQFQRMDKGVTRSVEESVELMDINNAKNTNNVKSAMEIDFEFDADSSVKSMQILPNNTNNSNTNNVNSDVISEKSNTNNNVINEEKSEIKKEYLRMMSTCYACQRKWPLFALEFFTFFPICAMCPKHIRIGHNRKCKEDWFCPYCHHSAKCVLFPSIKSENDTENQHSFGTNGVLLSRIVHSEHKQSIFLYIQPNDSDYWKTYLIQRVNNEQTGDITVRDKRNRKNINIVLSEVPNPHILWAYHCPSDKKQYLRDTIASVKSFDDETCTMKPIRAKEFITVGIGQVITNGKYLTQLCTKTMKDCKQKKIAFDRAIIFKYCRQFNEEKKAKKLKKNQFGKDTIIEESAPENSRYFNENISENESKMTEIIPNYSDTTPQLLSFCNLSSVPRNLLTPPQRELTLESIEQYSLTLLIGPSGSGKSTLLRSLQAQNPEQITFKSPDELQWHHNKCIISEFGHVSIDTAMNCMSSIGLNNIRTWLKPFHILSAGEQYRCGFARLLQESANQQNTKFIIMDEFTSVLDRNNARCMSAATSKCIRKNKKEYQNKCANFVLASANADIIRYLQPDLLILLGENNGMKLIENPNDLNSNIFDVKAVLDLPPFKKRRSKEELENTIVSISKLTVFDDLEPFDTDSIDKKVRELKCRVEMDSHATQTSTILDVEDFNGECVTHIPCLQQRHIRNDFNIGMIVGPSGCGKTSSGERLFGKPKPTKWDNNRNIASHFQSLQSIKELFFAVDLPLCIGFSHFHCLSEGEQHRVDIARSLDSGSNVLLIDEFTSYLDRITAKKVAKGVSDYIYRHELKNIVFLCCKYDIISSRNGMSPSWIFDVQNKKITHYKRNSEVTNVLELDSKLNVYAKHEFIVIRNLFNPPKIRLVLKPCSQSDFSPTFARYHYMDASIICSAKCYSVWAHFSYQNGSNNNGNNINALPKSIKSDKEEASDSDEMEEDLCANEKGYYKDSELELVGFVSILNHFGRPLLKLSDGVTTKKIDYREHRTVILPSFQGLGFGSRIADTLGEYLALHGCRLHSKTAHPRYGGYRDRKPSLWIPTRSNGNKATRTQWKNDCERMIYGSVLKNVGLAKKYYVHVFKLHSDQERTKEANELLNRRVIVKNTYKILT